VAVQIHSQVIMLVALSAASLALQITVAMLVIALVLLTYGGLSAGFRTFLLQTLKMQPSRSLVDYIQGKTIARRQAGYCSTSSSGNL